MCHAWNAFHHAVRQLTGPGSQKERLHGACGAALVRLKRRDIPVEIRPTFDALLARIAHLGGAGAPGREALRQKIASLSDGQVALSVIDIVCIHDVITRYQPAPAPHPC